MRKLLFGLAAVSALSAVAPAAAQYPANFWQSTRDWDISRERWLVDLERRLDADVRRGVVSPAELPRLRDLLWRARDTKARSAVGGFNGWERSTIDQAIGRFNDALRYAESYNNGGRVDPRTYPDSRYGWDNRGYDRNDAWARGNRDDGDRWTRDDRDDDGWNRDDDDGDRDDGDYGQGGRWGDSDDADRGDDRGWNQNARSEPPARQWDSGGAGRADDGTPLDLRVGDPAPVNLSPVPQQYRSRYPDGNGIYYRYDNGRIFQVDSRTDTIRWVGTID